MLWKPVLKNPIQETKHLLTKADSCTNTKKPAIKAKLARIFFLARQFYTLYEKKFSNLRPLLSLLFPKDFGLWEVGAKRRLNGVNKWKKTVKNLFCRGNISTFMSKNFKIWDHFFPLLFPKDSENLICLDIGLRDYGVKNTNTKKSCSVRQNLPKN